METVTPNPRCPTAEQSAARAGLKVPEAHLEEFGHGADSSAAKALALIDAFAGDRSVLGVTDLANIAGLPKSTVHRLLTVLVAQGYVRRVDDRYCLSDHVFEVGNSVWLCRPNGLRHRATPFLAELFAQTHQTIHLAVLNGTEVLYVEKLFGHGASWCDTAVGSRKPAYVTALGKAMLAYSSDELVERNMSVPFKLYTQRTIAGPADLERDLERTRSAGFALDLEEYRSGVTCIAAPIRDPQSGIAIAGVSICSTNQRISHRRFSAPLIDIAKELSRSPMAVTP